MQLNATYACRVFFNYLWIFRSFFGGRRVRPAGDYRGAFFGELLLPAVVAGRFIRPDANGIQHRAALIINPVTGGQPRCERILQVMRCPVECALLQVRRESADMYQLRARMAVSSAPKPSSRWLILSAWRSNGRGCTFLRPAEFPPGHPVFPGGSATRHGVAGRPLRPEGVPDMISLPMLKAPRRFPALPADVSPRGASRRCGTWPSIQDWCTDDSAA